MSRTTVSTVGFVDIMNVIKRDTPTKRQVGVALCRRRRAVFGPIPGAVGGHSALVPSPIFVVCLPIT